MFCLSREDVALHAGGGRWWGSLQWHQTTSIEVYFRGRKRNQAQHGSVIGRTRDDAKRARSRVRAGGGAVALMVELKASYPTLSASSPLASYRYDNEVRVWGYTENLGSPRQVAGKAGDDPGEVALDLLGIGAAEDDSESVGWKSPE